MENFFNSLYDTFSQTDSEGLKKIAGQIGGQYKNAGTLKGQQISVVYGGISIFYDVVAISRGGTSDFRVKAEFKSHTSYHLVMNTKVCINFYIYTFGWMAAFKAHKYKKIEVSDRLSQNFNVHGTDEAITERLIDEKTVKIMSDASFHTFQIHCDGESGKIYALYGNIGNTDALLKTHHMVCSLIDHMKEQKMIEAHSAL